MVVSAYVPVCVCVLVSSSLCVPEGGMEEGRGVKGGMEAGTGEKVNRVAVQRLNCLIITP